MGINSVVVRIAKYLPSLWGAGGAQKRAVLCRIRAHYATDYGSWGGRSGHGDQVISSILCRIIRREDLYAEFFLGGAVSAPGILRPILERVLWIR